MKYLPILLMTIFSHQVFSQKSITTFEDLAKNKNISIESLNRLYKSMDNIDSLTSVFKGQENEFLNGSMSLIQELGDHLKKNNFKLFKPFESHIKFCINKNGKIDYFLYDFKENKISSNTENEFKRLIELFIKEYTFPLKPNSNFSIDFL